MNLTTHIHISEREPDGTWEDCTWDAGLEFYRDAIDPSKPATHAEAQALRAASGEPATGGSNMTDLRRGVKARYGVSLPAAINARNVLIALKPGYVSITQGSMSAFGPLHPLSQWDRNFDGGHAVWIARTPDGKLLWCDPEAPKSADVPVYVTDAQVQKYVNAFAGEAIVAPALEWAQAQQEDAVEPIVKYLPGYTANIKPLSNVRAAPRIAATKFRTTGSAKEPVVLIGTVKGDPDPGNANNTEWYMWWKNARYEFTATDNILDVAAPAAADDGYTKETQDAAVAAQKAADEAACAEAVATATAAATAAEKERIAVEMGEASADAIRGV